MIAINFTPLQQQMQIKNNLWVGLSYFAEINERVKNGTLKNFKDWVKTQTCFSREENFLKIYQKSLKRVFMLFVWECEEGDLKLDKKCF